MAFSTVYSRVRRALPALGGCAAALFLASCNSETTGVGTPGFARLNVQPQFSSSQFVPVTLDRVEALVERITVDSSREGTTSDTLLESSRNFSPSSNELQLTLRVPLQGSSETLRVTLAYFAGPTLLFIGSDDIEVSVGGSANPEPFNMNYVGPGSNAVGLIIEPFDTTVTAGSTTPFRASAIDGQQNDVGPFYLKWSVSSTANSASIDAAGRLKAPTQPGTLWVKGLLPNGVDDSVQVTVTGTPGGIQIVSGDHQTGTAGNQLQAPFVVQVTTSSGAPVADVSVSWAATVGGGGFEVSTTTTDGQGNAQNFGIIGQNPGVNRFTATVAGVGSVTFSANENQTGNTVSWIGNTSGVWSNPANWSGSQVPGPLDSVVIASNSAAFSPVLDTTPIVGAMTLGGSRSLTLASHGLVVIRNLTVQGNATLEMVTPNDVITVGGDAVFDGGDSRGHLTAGVISIGGNFTQRATNSGQSYSATGEHITSMATGTTAISFATPGTGNGQSSFQDFYWSATGTLTMSSNVVARGTAYLGFAGNTTISSSGGFNLSAAQMATSNQIPLVFNNVTVTLADTALPINFLGLLTFQNMPTNRAQLTLSYPGGTILLNQFVFSTTPVSPNGYYIDATDTRVGDGSNLTVQVQNPTPTSMGTFFREGGDAEIIWPYSPP